MFNFVKNLAGKVVAAAFALAACVFVSAAALAQSSDPQFTNAADVVTNTNVDLSSYAGVMGKVLGTLLATIIVVALCFIVIKKGFRALSTWIKA